MAVVARARGETAVGSATITPNDGANLTRAARFGLYITVGGTVKITGVDGTINTITVPANFVLRIATIKVFATGTTATGIHALY